MASESDIVHYKTQAWADPRMVNWYAHKVSENVADNRLKNHVETALIRAHVRGAEILDVGIGSGRASLPLLETGIRLSGIDSSQAMLDECRRRAGGQALDLRLGDVTAIPYADASFDSLVSLNVMTHFPHWREVLREWLRVLRPGGRLVFDLYSLDHIEAVMARRGPGLEHLLPGSADITPSAFNMRARVAELADFARQQDIALLSIQPYCGVLGGDQNYWMRQGWAQGRIWDRMKSWIAVDDQLFQFLVFLEQEGYARLNSKSCARFMVVFEKRPDQGETDAVLDYQDAIDAALAGPVDFAALEAFLGEAAMAWRQRLNQHLDHPSNRLYLFQLLSAGLDDGMEIRLDSWLEPRHHALFDRWVLAYQLDRQIMDLARGWYQPHAELMQYKGVPLGPGLEYENVQRMMRTALYNDPNGTGDRHE